MLYHVIQTYEILPQFQKLSVGDRLSDGGPYVTEERGNWVVKSIDPGRSLVLYAARQVSEGTDFDRDQRKPRGIWFICSWAFVLEPLEREKTRLMVRVRAIGGPAWFIGMIRLGLGKGDTVAHSSMFERLKARAEASYYRQRSGLSSPVP